MQGFYPFFHRVFRFGADKGKEGFYEKLGFVTRRAADLGPGMIMWPLPQE